MIKRITIIALLVAFIAAEATAQHTHRRRGAILGGLAGAALGVAIGDKGNNETAGALIGGTVGAIAGGTIGHQKDQRIQHNRRYHSGYQTYPYHSPHSGHHYQGGHYRGAPPNYHQPYYYPQQTQVYPTPAPAILPAEPGVPVETMAEPAADTVSKQDVITMIRNGMSETLIIQQLRLHGFRGKLSVADVIELHEMGVSEPIITAMQTSSAIESGDQVIVEPGQSYRVPTTPVPPFGTSILEPSN